MADAVHKEAGAQPASQSEPTFTDLIVSLEKRITALEEAMSGHNHEVGPDLIRLIAMETKKEVLAHLKRQFGAHIAHFLLDGMPE